MKLTIVVAAFAALALAGCQSTKPLVVNNTEYVVIKPPAALLNCPQLGTIPNPETLTNKQVADFIDKLYRYHKICGINMNAIKKYVAEAERLYK